MGGRVDLVVGLLPAPHLCCKKIKLVEAGENGSQPDLMEIKLKVNYGCIYCIKWELDVAIRMGVTQNTRIRTTESGQ